MTNKEIIQSIIEAKGKCHYLPGFVCRDCPLHSCDITKILDLALMWKERHIGLWHTETKTINGIKYKLEPITEFKAGCDYVWVGEKVWPERWVADMTFVFDGEVHRCINADGLNADLGDARWWKWYDIENFRKATAVGETVYIPPVGQNRKQKLSDKIDKVRFD